MGRLLRAAGCSSALACATAVILVGGCKSSSPAGAPAPPASVSFPPGFMWGTATAAFQVEKGNGDTDWGQWAALPGKIKNGDTPDNGGPDALAHTDGDVQLMKDAGMTAYRFSIEWARLYPTRAAFDADTPDPAGVAAYTSLLAKLRAAKITPLVTMIHYSLPAWLDDVSKPAEPQGFERPETPALVGEYCKRMGKLFGGDVDWWATLNEPTLPPLTGYIAGRYPPGLILDAARAVAALRGEAHAHVSCYDALKAADTVDADGDGKPAWVSLVNQSRVAEPLDPTNPDDVAAAAHLGAINNRWFWDIAVRGNWDDDLNGDFTGPNDKQGDASLKGRADYVGLNYYSTMTVSAHQGIVIPILNVAAPMLDHQPTTRPKTDASLDIYPEGLAKALDELAPYGLPFVLTENGIADGADANRPRFLAEHLYQLGWAMQRGVDVRGYFHWSIVDNFEWDGGFCPKFGLVAIDHVTGARAPRPSLAAYTAIVRAGQVLKADVDKLPAYAPPTVCP